MITGYSGKSLIDKLGYKAGEKVQLYNAPDWLQAYLLECQVNLVQTRPVWLHGFYTSTNAIAKFLHLHSLDMIQKGFWVSWPKKSSGVESDLNEQIFRDLILTLDWVDTKVCAIDDTWSGLLFRRHQN